MKFDECEGDRHAWDITAAAFSDGEPMRVTCRCGECPGSAVRVDYGSFGRGYRLSLDNGGEVIPPHGRGDRAEPEPDHEVHVSAHVITPL